MNISTDSGFKLQGTLLGICCHKNWKNPRLHQSIQNYQHILSEIERHNRGRNVSLIAVSKTFAAEHILPVIHVGHRKFGENRVQEAKAKWPEIRQRFEDIELHLIGPLQSNKVKDAVELFDVIQSVDREKIARALNAEMEKQQRYLPVFIQVNIGEEPQKAGIAPKEAVDFVNHCLFDLKLDVRGLMCIPPFEEPARDYFVKMQSLAQQTSLSELSMGMSGDFAEAIEFGATMVRVGSAIFGAR